MFALSLMMVAYIAVSAAGQDLKPEEVVARHLDSLGKKEARETLKTLMAVGQSEFESRVPAIKGGGRAVVVSDPSNLFFVLSLNSKEYPFEKIGFFNGKQSLPFVTPGGRSLLGTFIAEHEKVLSGGLFNGSMSLNWALLHVEKMKPIMKSGGTKNIDGRRVHVINYFTSGGSSEFTIKLYFDGETFHHVRSEYRREIRAKTPVFGVANQISNSTLELTEYFADFRVVENVTLPFSYRVEFSSNSGSSTYQSSWGIKVEQYVLNQKLTADFFTFDIK